MQSVNYSLASLVGGDIQIVSKDESYVRRALHLNIGLEEDKFLTERVKFISASDRFKDVIDLFKVPEGETPAGFEIKYNMKENQVLEIDLARNISYDKNGKKRPTKFIYSADTANPYEVEPIKNLIGNLTCNPGITCSSTIRRQMLERSLRLVTRLWARFATSLDRAAISALS